MYRLTEKGWGQPRWSALTPAASAALVGYVYAERHLQRGHLFSEALVCALWCAGAPWDQIGEAARDLARAALDAHRDDPDRRALALGRATRALQLFEVEPPLCDRLRAEIADFQREAVGLDELSIYAAALGSGRDRERAFAATDDGGFVGALRGGGEAWMDEIIACVRGGIERGERSSEPDSPKLLNRAVGYRDVGRGVLWAAMIPIGATLGLDLPPIPDDLSDYVSPNFPS